MAVYSVVDLFAGAGGLSLGFMQTGKFEIKAAFENNPNMQKTYHHNHPNVDLRGDICGEDADYDEIKEKHGNIDIVIAGSCRNPRQLRLYVRDTARDRYRHHSGGLRRRRAKTAFR